MDVFAILQVDLFENDSAKDEKKWFLLNSKIFGNPPSKFMVRSPLVANFPNEFNIMLGGSASEYF